MKSTAKTIGIVMVIMLLSRLLALASYSFYISRFGVNIDTDIYTYATQLPNIIFNSFGTALVTVIIPIFAGYIATDEKQRAFKFVDNIISLALIFTVVLSVLCIIAAPAVLFFTPRFKDYDANLTLFALKVMFPIMIFYAMNYIFQGILQSLGKFNMPAFVSIPSSLVVITYVLLFDTKYGIRGLVVATFIGLTLQALILIPPIFKTEYRYHPSFKLKDEDIKMAIKLVPPVLIGTSAYQVNMFFNNTFSSSFQDTVTIMVWVQNLILYAILAFIYSITAVIFPKFTALIAKNDMEGFKSSLIKVLKSILYFLIPCTAGFIAVRYQLIGLLVKWGKVTESNVVLASGIMALYAIGISGVGIKEVVDRAFYSLKDTVKPAVNGVIIMVANILFSLGLTAIIGVYGIPLAYSIASLVGGSVILILIKKKLGTLGMKSLLQSAFKVLISSGIMFVMVIFVNYTLEGYTFGFAILDRIIKLIIPVTVGALVYFVSTYFLKVEEAVNVLDKIKSRLSLK